MKRIVILGAGTGGTIMANKLSKTLKPNEWEIIIVDQDKAHYYQPGFLFVPFGIYSREDVTKQKQKYLPKGIQFIYDEITKIEAQQNKVALKSGQIIDYDFLIIATGTEIKPEETPGMKGMLWQKSIFDFYTVEGAVALRSFFEKWEGGRLVMSITELPYKCPVAPLEFVFLADAYFTKQGIRNIVDITYVTPLSGAFTKPLAAKMLGDVLIKKNIKVVPDFYTEKIDENQKKLISYDGQQVPFDVLAVVPVNKGNDVIGQSGLGDDLNFVLTNKYTLQSEKYSNIFVIGDASNIPTSKAGSVAHFAAEVVFENLMSAIKNKPLTAVFDGHANCFIETGYGKGTIIDFNYDVEPMPGMYPIPFVGPFGMMKVSRLNHFGKLFFRWVYWNLILPAKNINWMLNARKFKKTK